MLGSFLFSNTALTFYTETVQVVVLTSWQPLPKLHVFAFQLYDVT